MNIQQIDFPVYNIARYFDNYFEANVFVNLTKEEADEKIKTLKSGAYVSYEIRKA